MNTVCKIPTATNEIVSRPAPIILPIKRNLLSAELTEDKLIRTYKELELYIVTAEDSPCVMDEIGRIREAEFRRDGGGTGRSKDIDGFDYGLTAYRQLVVWDPINKEIVSMYRYILCQDAIYPDGSIKLSMAHQFEFSQNFQDSYLIKAIELDRSVVNRSAKRCKIGLLAAWHGLGALLREYRNVEYIFGKVIIPSVYPQAARNLLLTFFQRYHANADSLVQPRAHTQVYVDDNDAFLNDDYKTALTRIKKQLKNMGQGIPPLVNTYLKTGGNDIQYFGSAYNRRFGNAISAAMLLPIASIKAKPRQQFMDSYTSINAQRFRELDLKQLEKNILYLEKTVWATMIAQKEHFLSCPLQLQVA